MVIQVVGDDSSKIKRATCNHCAAILEYTLADTTTDTIRDYTGCADTYRYLRCPRCGSNFTVPMY